jgi:hypothetical protein
LDEVIELVFSAVDKLNGRVVWRNIKNKELINKITIVQSYIFINVRGTDNGNSPFHPKGKNIFSNISIKVRKIA